MGLSGAMSVTRTGGPDAMTCRNVKLREASTTITNMSSPTIVVRGVSRIAVLRKQVPL